MHERALRATSSLPAEIKGLSIQVLWQTNHLIPHWLAPTKNSQLCEMIFFSAQHHQDNLNIEYFARLKPNS